MHHALQLDEILLNVFSYCHSPCVKTQNVGRRGDCFSTVDLAALARTCRTFKEPALDVLWSELTDLTPLARCLPEICYQITRGYKWYTFHRPLEQEDWNIIRSYTRRVRSVLDFGSAFHPDCVEAFLSPPGAEPLFPNLRHLCCVFANEITPLLRQSFPSLISLEYAFVFEGNLSLFRDSLESFPHVSPNVAHLAIRVHSPEAIFDQVVSDYICRWSNPRIVSCYQVTLNVDAVKHLSRTSDLTRLSFTLDAALPDWITHLDMLCFNRLQELELHSGSLIPASKFLARIQLPVVRDFTVRFENIFSKHDVASFLDILQASGMANSVMRLGLFQYHLPVRSSASRSDNAVVCDDLRPIMAFKSLRRLDFNLKWDVKLTDNNLVELASAWPHLEILLINREWGWRQAPHGITLDGIVRLMQTSRSLSQLALAVDARGCVEAQLVLPHVHPALDPSRTLSIDVVDSTIEAASVPGVVAFFTHLIPSGQFSLTAWRSHAFHWTRIIMQHPQRWRDVFAQTAKVNDQRCQSRVNLHPK